MLYRKMITLKDGRECLLRNGTAQDAEQGLDVFVRTHEQTDWLLSYPDEIRYTLAQQSEYLQNKTQSDKEIELVAEIDGVIVGLAGIDAVGNSDKTRHRAEFGISILREYWGLGIGRAMTRACIECAARAGYAQLELSVVADNLRAIALYRSEGFTEYGCNPRGFRSRTTGWQPLTLMRLELQ